MDSSLCTYDSHFSSFNTEDTHKHMLYFNTSVHRKLMYDSDITNRLVQKQCSRFGAEPTHDTDITTKRLVQQ